jgi:hypothetical protein
VASDDDDAQLMARLAKLEAEVKADSARDTARKEQALAAARAKRQAQLGEQQALRNRQAELVGKNTALAKRTPVAADDDDDAADDSGSDRGMGGLLKLAGRAADARDELAAPTQAGEKSWVKSGLLSAAFGPFGWLYAGAWFEAIPAAAGWLAVAMILKILPWILVMPVLMVALPASGIVGALYAVRFNRKGSRQRMFTPTPEPKTKRALKRPPRERK